MSDSALRWTGPLVPRVRGLFASDALAAMRRNDWLLLRALILAVAYYIGARVGFAFKAPSVPQSIMWLPNSILLAALIMAPTRQWPWLLLASYPAQLLGGWQGERPLGPVSLLYVTNCLDAALGASVVRLAAGGRWRLDSLKSLLIFFVSGAVIGPLFISYLDAGITVLTGYGDSYWTAYWTRLRANTLTNVILVPTLIGAVQPGYLAWWRAPLRRFPEAGVLFAGLLVVAAMVFSRPLDGRLAYVYLPLPFLLWAAVRFGPGVTGAALLMIAFVSSWTAMRSQSGFAGLDALHNVSALQFFLLCLSVPLLSLAMVVREREGEKEKLIASGDEVRRQMDRSRDLAGRLISAQECESNRIARELHDGVGQYVADLALTISALKRVPRVRDAGLDSEFLRLFQQTSNLFESVRSLSHQLHPSVLRHAGLVAATDSLCHAFTRQHEIQCEFHAEPVEPLSDDVSLCAYRVTQEALRNVVSHSDARRVTVTLKRTSDMLSLSVVDDGQGFDPRAHSAGLGLVSMEERVRLVRGQLEIASGPQGSRISVRIPLEDVA